MVLADADLPQQPADAGPVRPDDHEEVLAASADIGIGVDDFNVASNSVGSHSPWKVGYSRDTPPPSPDVTHSRSWLRPDT